MKGLLSFTEQFFWTTVWIFLVLIVGFSLLSWLKGQNGPIGDFAGWVSAHAEPQSLCVPYIVFSWGDYGSQHQ